MPNDHNDWTPPDDATIVAITKTVAADIARGDSKAEIVDALTTGDGWPRDVAAEFVDSVERELARRQERLPPVAPRDIFVLVVVAGVLMMVPVGIMLILGLNTVTQVGGGFLWAFLVFAWWRWWRRRRAVFQ